jgi:hypothetical protein
VQLAEAACLRALQTDVKDDSLVFVKTLAHQQELIEGWIARKRFRREEIFAATPTHPINLTPETKAKQPELRELKVVVAAPMSNMDTGYNCSALKHTYSIPYVVSSHRELQMRHRVIRTGNPHPIVTNVTVMDSCHTFEKARQGIEHAAEWNATLRAALHA